MARQAAAEWLAGAGDIAARAPIALSPVLPAHYTIAQAAAYLQTSEKTLRRMIAAGDLAEVRIGRQIRIAEPDLVALMHKGRSR